MFRRYKKEKEDGGKSNYKTSFLGKGAKYSFGQSRDSDSSNVTSTYHASSSVAHNVTVKEDKVKDEDVRSKVAALSVEDREKAERMEEEEAVAMVQEALSSLSIDTDSGEQAHEEEEEETSAVAVPQQYEGEEEEEEEESGFGSVLGEEDVEEDEHGAGEEGDTQRPTSPSPQLSMSELKLTKPAPNFAGTAVVNGDFKEISLADYRGKYLVFFFYPLDFTFVCPTELIAFSERAEEFRSIGCEVVGCSTDSHFSHLAWINTPRKQGGLGSMNIPLLADKSGDIARRYGVLIEEDGIAFRGLFIVDDKGNLRQITINDLPVGRSVDEALRLVQAFQFTDKHGEVCPAGWKPGQDTMKPSVNESKSFFQKNH